MPIERRYRAAPSIAEVDPVIEPLTDLDSDEDAIDRLLINTGFDAEDDVSVLSAGKEIMLPVRQDPAAPYDGFSGEDVVPAALQTHDDEFIEPVDIGSPLADDELAPYEAASANIEVFAGPHDSVSAVGEYPFSTPDKATPEFASPMQDAFSAPVAANRAFEPAELTPPLPETGQKEAFLADNASFEDRYEPFCREPGPAGILPDPAGGEATVLGNTIPPAGGFSLDETRADVPRQQGISLDAPAPAGEWRRLLSAQEDARHHIALLDAKAKNARRLSYAAIILSFAALCAGSAAFYLVIQTRTELSKLQDMQSIMEEDLGGLNEKLDSDKQADEAGAETPSSFTDEGQLKSEGKPAAVQAPPDSETRPLRAASLPAIARGKSTSEPPMRKTHVLPEKPAAEDAVAHWSVNLASFRQMKDARKKAAEFRQKGVQVKVTKVDIKHATWYRLNVPGFATKEAASAHSARLKKLLRLNTIWVAAI